MDPRIELIRSDGTIGHGTCSAVDEAMTDEEIIELLDSLGITDPSEALTHMQEGEQTFQDYAEDIRNA